MFHRYCEVVGSNLIGSPESFSGFLCNCINCIQNFEDRSSFVLNITVSNHSVKVIVIHLFIRSTLRHIARNYAHKKSLDCLIIMIQTFIFATSYTGCTGQKAGYGC